MDQLLQQANSAGLSDSQGKDALGGIFSLLKNNISSEDFSKIESAIPETGSLVEAAETQTRAGGESGGGMGGLMSSAMGMLGGGGASNSGTSGGAAGGGGMQNIPQLLGFLSGKGVDQNMMGKFMPMVTKFLQGNAGVDTSSALGVPGQSSGGAGGSDLMGQAANLLGGFGK